jgi:hypothetical protein
MRLQKCFSESRYQQRIQLPLSLSTQSGCSIGENSEESLRRKTARMIEAEILMKIL